MDETELTEDWDCPHCDKEFTVDVSSLPMNGVICCPYCGKEIKEALVA